MRIDSVDKAGNINRAAHCSEVRMTPEQWAFV